MAGRDVSISAARWLVGVMTSVVLAFVVATLTAQHVQSAIAARASDIIGNAMPSVKLLSAARGDLHRMEHDVEHEAAGAEDRAALESEIAVARQDMAEAVTSYLTLPFFPQEQSLFAPVANGIAKLDAEHAAWRSSRSPGGLAALRSDFIAVDAAIERSIAFDAEQGQRLGLEIEQIRGESKGVVTLLDSLAVVLASGAAVLALRQLRRAAQARRLELAARERREAELAERNEALGQFAGRVAHDILSPLTSAALSLDLVRQACGHDRASLRAIERGLAGVRRVHALVDGLLAFARAGGTPAPGTRADLTAVLGDLLQDLGEQAQERGIALSVAPLPRGQVACSAGVLTSIVSNLVQNAVKYMHAAGERRITVRVDDAGSCWHIEVHDTGPGIPDEQQGRIFEPYVQLGTGSGGIGLGLATVDRLVRAHGGKVGVRSQLGSGSTFWCELPKPRELAAAVDAAAQPAAI